MKAAIRYRAQAEDGLQDWGYFLDPVRFARERLGFAPDALQERVLRAECQFGILNCSRQWGKSTICVIKALHRMVMEEEALVMVISPSDRQSREFVRKTKAFVRKLGYAVRGDGDSKVSIQLPNGSRMVGLPSNEDTIRGLSGVSLLLVDEAAKVPDELYLTVRPMLAVSGGDVWLMSTPKGKRGFFYKTWVDGGKEWTHHFDQIDWLRQHLHTLRGTSWFENRFPEVVVLPASKNRLGEIAVYPERQGR